jgi:hypothetical protein
MTGSSAGALRQIIFRAWILQANAHMVATALHLR